MDKEQLERAKLYITEQYVQFGDSPWLEGWICGYTDIDHGEMEELEQAKDELFAHLESARRTFPDPAKLEDTTEKIKVRITERARQWLLDASTNPDYEDFQLCDEDGPYILVDKSVAREFVRRGALLDDAVSVENVLGRILALRRPKV